MRIAEITAHTVRLPLVHGFETSSHRKDYLEHILLEVTSEDGSLAWGEIASPSGPYYSSETTATASLLGREYLGPIARDVTWEHPAALAGALAKVRGHEFAKAGLDIAAWSLFAHSRGQSMAAALGGERTRVEAGVSLGIEPTIDDLLEQVRHHVEDGYDRVKLKIKPGWDVEPVRAVREAFGSLRLHVDANGVYPDDESTTTTMRALDPFALAMIEQPYAPRAFVASAALARLIDTPICLDEAIVDVDDVRTMLALGSASIVNLKVSRMGGLTAVRAAHDLLHGEGIPVWCGGMHEFGVGRAANLAICTLPGFTYPSDVSGSDKYYRDDVVHPAIRAEQGWVAVPTQPGLGLAVDEDLIAAHTVRSERW